MTIVFTTVKDYVHFLTSLDPSHGMSSCLTYLPSALFPKHSLDFFYTHADPVEHHKAIAEELWAHGRRQLKDCRLQKIIIDRASMVSFGEHGIVHAAVSRFEVGFNIRAAVLRQLRSLIRNDIARIADGPFPYVFRLTPPNGVLLDVDRNRADQHVQGIWIDDASAYTAFEVEFQRLWNTAGAAQSVRRRVEVVDAAIVAVEHGEAFSWPAT